jgi:hypothetical protein
MKSRPIIFSSHMVRAILAGTKTQTRRIVKPQPIRINANGAPVFPNGKVGPWEHLICPHGQVGDQLWVKETAIIAPKRFADPDDTCIPDADGDPRYIQYIASHPDTEAAGWDKLKKTPSLFMPRWASRITLEITGVYVERLQDISEWDAEQEGIDVFEDGMGWSIPNAKGELQGWKRNAADAFADLWQSIHGPDSWEQNPWVWKISFRRIKP